MPSLSQGRVGKSGCCGGSLVLTGRRVRHSEQRFTISSLSNWFIPGQHTGSQARRGVFRSLGVLREGYLKFSSAVWRV